MKTVIYLDALLLVNFVIAYFLLMTAGLLSGLHAPFGRMAAAAAFSAATALILLVPELPYPSQLAYKLITAAIIIGIAYGWHSLRRSLTAACWYAAFNVLLAGLALLVIYRHKTSLVQTANLTVYLQISPLVLMGLSALCWGGVELLLRFMRAPTPQNNVVGIEVILCGASVRLRAVLDTGCHIKDPITCLPVLLVSYPAAKSRLPQPLTEYLEQWFAGQRDETPPGNLHLRLVPCATAAGQALLPGFSVPDIGVISQDGVVQSGRSAIVFSPQQFGEDEYEALYGNDFL